MQRRKTVTDLAVPSFEVYAGNQKSLSKSGSLTNITVAMSRKLRMTGFLWKSHDRWFPDCPDVMEVYCEHWIIFIKKR